MTGQILDYSIQTNSGAISGDDGNRYSFTGADWQEAGAPQPGTRVDFEANGNVAAGIYSEARVAGATLAVATPAAGAVAASIDMGMEVANPWLRVLAYLLEALLAVLTLGIGYLIWLVIVMARGQTPGKQLLGLRVVRQDGTAASWGLMFGRGLCKFIVGLIPFYIGYIISFVMMLSGPEHRTIHDRMVNTLVVRNRR
jgi:uncharacterized RDD family membrane protein YckC